MGFAFWQPCSSPAVTGYLPLVALPQGPAASAGHELAGRHAPHFLSLSLFSCLPFWSCFPLPALHYRYMCAAWNLMYSPCAGKWLSETPAAVGAGVLQAGSQQGVPASGVGPGGPRSLRVCKEAAWSCGNRLQGGQRFVWGRFCPQGTLAMFGDTVSC